MVVSKYVESLLDKLGDEQMIELAVWLHALSREEVKIHILEYDFSEEEIREALEAIGLNPEDLE